MEIQNDAQKPLEIDDLPVEILEKIFLSMTIGDLLKSRFISQKWKIISTRICRHRYVTLKIDRHNNAPRNRATTLKQTFKDRENIPWSSCSTKIFVLPYGRPNMLKFLKEFGSSLFEWIFVPESLVFHFVGLCKLLKLTPNLRRLEIPQYGNNPRLFVEFDTVTGDTISPLSLPFLKFLQLGINDQSIKIFKLLLRSAPLLQYLETAIDFREDKVLESKELATILATIPSLSLDVEYERTNLVKALLASKLRIDEFILRMDDTPGSNPGFYTLAEEFLSLNSKKLTSLTLFWDAGTNKFSNFLPLRVPCFPLLHTLKLQFYVTPNLNMLAPPLEAELYHKFTAFQCNQFPVLKKVVIHAQGLERSSTIFTRPGNQPVTTRYESVTELAMSSSFIHDEWAKIFPNLKRYDASLGDEGLLYLLTNLQQLEVMDLLLMLNGDANALLSGINEPEAVYRQSAGVIVERRAASGRPSLVDFKNLRRLELTFEVATNKEQIFRDCGAYLSVLELNSLEYLSILNAKISEACVDKLKQRHLEFTTKEANFGFF